jgi:hypothetical protein
LILEAQCQEFKNQTQPDGTPKLWLYFAAFEKATHDLSSDLTQVGIYTQKTREWLQQKTDSVPALLALCGTLLGEIGKIRDTASKPPTPDNLQQLRQRADELNRIHQGFPEPAVLRLINEPQYYATTLQFFELFPNTFDHFQELQNDLLHFDPYYVPFFVGVDPTVVSPAAISITAAPAERSCQGRTAHTGSRGFWCKLEKPALCVNGQR